MQNHVPSELVQIPSSLPPNVSGNCRELFQVNGKIKFPKALLHLQNKQSSLKAEWWGEETPSTARIDENNSFNFVYQIKTSRKLLEKYFKSCEEVRIALFSGKLEIASTKFKTKDIFLDQTVHKIYTLVNKKYRVVAKIKVHFKMLGVCPRIEDYSQSGLMQKDTFMLRVDCLKIRQAYKLPSLFTTDFRMFCKVDGVEFECKSSHLCDDSMGEY